MTAEPLSWTTASGDTVEVWPSVYPIGHVRYGQVHSWWWHLKSPNNQIIATSGESFTRKSSAKRAALRSFPKAETA